MPAATRIDQRLRERTWFCKECGQQLHLRKRVDSKQCGLVCANRYHSRKRKLAKEARAKPVEAGTLDNFARKQLGLPPIYAVPQTRQSRRNR